MSQRQTYLDKVLALQREETAMQEPGLHHVVVRHDEWCHLLLGTGQCNCNPEVAYDRSDK